jgi:hypothetical protein
MIVLRRTMAHAGHKMTTIHPANIDTGYRIVSGSIDAGGGPTGYHVAEERILHGTVDTGYFVAGETIYQKPRLDTGFRVSGGIVWGPGSELPFLAEHLERPLAKTTKIDPLPTLPAYAPAG